MSFSKKITDLKREVLKESEPLFAHIEDVAEANTLKVLDAMRECRVSDAHFNTTTGYAYDDIGRGKLEELYAKIFGAERALVRTQFVSGTHALATVLFGILPQWAQVVQRSYADAGVAPDDGEQREVRGAAHRVADGFPASVHGGLHHEPVPGHRTAGARYTPGTRAAPGTRRQPGTYPWRR